jgi:hypothetical protein
MTPLSGNGSEVRWVVVARATMRRAAREFLWCAVLSPAAAGTSEGVV